VVEPFFQVAWREGAWCLRDLGSTNGSAVNGKTLSGEPSDWVALKDGDLVKLGTETVVRGLASAISCPLHAARLLATRLPHSSSSV
jgi:pSer/pThr/pTyr-binding forkhead associated (FHA) protein